LIRVKAVGCGRIHDAAVNQLTLFVCGDVMTGRGIDQILPHPCDPAIHEPWVKSALDYVSLAQERNGPIPRAVAVDYIWGDALGELARVRPHARVVNLETAVTRSGDWVDKGINYRMHPANVGCLSAAGIDCCVLANNHVLDWGEAGLEETLDTLHSANIRTAGAGKDRVEAEAPAQLAIGADRRILVFAVGLDSSGVPRQWAAQAHRPGVDFLADLSEHSVERLAQRILAAKRPGDLVVLSVHWGSNWGYEISSAEMTFAHRVIDRAGVDLLHGHSSHHPRPIEVHSGKLILYGCGDFINDYEGIHGYEAFRGDLGFMYFPTVDAGSGRLLRLELVATQIHRFRVRRAGAEDRGWLCAVIDREGQRFGTRTQLRTDGRIELGWTPS
jgi:poly-gamma-glutamate capsule biosynthesis protein CapA/YwtB (metallophosphatase superfamily)